MARVRLHKARQRFNCDSLFIDIAGQSSFDPSHPGTYPGNEVKVVETLSADDTLTKYGKDAITGPEMLYAQASAGQVHICQLTGRTSREVIYNTSDWQD